MIKEIFQDIYNRNMWNSPESRSGAGSELKKTMHLAEILPPLLRGLEIHSLIDAPCGDFNWMRKVDLPIQKYLGIDVVPELIERNIQQYANDRYSFARLDITTDPLPYADMIFSRDCLQHLDNANCLKALVNFKNSGAKYLLTSCHMIETNRDIQNGGYRPINFMRAPFNISEPLLMIPDHDGFPKYLCLWKM
jgi:hypothetical protein